MAPVRFADRRRWLPVKPGELDLDGARVAIQGFGAVSRHAAMELAERGARIVAVSDSTGAVEHPDGFLRHLRPLARVTGARAG